MRIISKFSDYYDAGVSFGVDQNLVYERKLQEESEFTPGRIPSPRMKYLNSHLWKRHHRTHYLYDKENSISRNRYESGNQGLLHFCGKEYPFYRVWTTDKKQPIKFCWDSESTDLYFNKGYDGWMDMYRNSTMGRQEWTVVANNEINLKFKSPIVTEIINHKSISYVINPNLKEMGFQKIVPPMEAFQEISMYLAMLQNPEDKELTPAPTDIEKINQHGMDPIYGFRKTPGEK